MRIFKHPTLRKLAAYLDKRIRGKEAEEIEEHLLACDTDKDVFDGMIEMQEQSDLTGEEIIEVIKQEKPRFEEILGKHEENSQTFFHELNNKKYWQVAAVTAAIIICCGMVPVQMSAIRTKAELAQVKAELAQERAIHAKNHAEASAVNSLLAQSEAEKAQSKAEKAAEEAMKHTNSVIAKEVLNSINENMKLIPGEQKELVSNNGSENTPILFSKYQITVFEFCVFLNHARISSEEAESWLGDIQYDHIIYKDDSYTPRLGEEETPVSVTLDGAKAFAKWTDRYRLPTPKELKYVAQLTGQNDDIFVGPADLELKIGLYHISDNIYTKSHSTFRNVSNPNNPSSLTNDNKESSITETDNPMNLAYLEWMETDSEFNDTHHKKYRPFRLASLATKDFLSITH